MSAQFSLSSASIKKPTLRHKFVHEFYCLKDEINRSRSAEVPLCSALFERFIRKAGAPSKPHNAEHSERNKERVYAVN